MSVGGQVICTQCITSTAKMEKCVTNVSLRFFLLMWLHALQVIHADLQLKVLPETAPEKDKAVMIQCTNVITKDDALEYPMNNTHMASCNFLWKRRLLHGNHQKKYTSLPSTSSDIIAIKVKNKYGVPYRSVLTINRMEPRSEGVYKCVMVCKGSAHSASTTITMREFSRADLYPMLGEGISSRVLGFFALGFLVVVLSIGGYFMSREYCNRRRRFDANSGTESTEALTARRLRNKRSRDDRPPRYSLVVFDDSSSEGSSVGSCQFSSDGSVRSVLVRKSSLPDYAEAMKDLKQQGVVFNPNNLKPMPPAYIEVVSSGKS